MSAHIDCELGEAERQKLCEDALLFCKSSQSSSDLHRPQSPNAIAMQKEEILPGLMKKSVVILTPYIAFTGPPCLNCSCKAFWYWLRAALIARRRGSTT